MGESCSKQIFLNSFLIIFFRSTDQPSRSNTLNLPGKTDIVVALTPIPTIDRVCPLPCKCANHSDSSAGCCTWSGFFISSTHHSYCTSVTNQFMANDYFFVLGCLCYHWSSFCSFGSYLHRVFSYFLLIVCFHLFFFGSCLLVLSFALYFDFYIQVFSSTSHTLQAFKTRLPGKVR